jgi:hypothetical protein
MQYQDRDMNFLNANPTAATVVNAAVVGVCEGTVAEAAAEGDTMSSEGWSA